MLLAQGQPDCCMFPVFLWHGGLLGHYLEGKKFVSFLTQETLLQNKHLADEPEVTYPKHL